MDPCPFGHVVREGGFAHAARAVGVTPSAISQAMGTLERELGRPLFERVGRGRRPTPLALTLARRAVELEASLAAASGASAASGGAARGRGRGTRAPIAIGMSTGAALMFGPVIAGPRSADGTIAPPVRIVHDDSIGLLNALRCGELDLAITPRPRGDAAADLDVWPLYTSAPTVYARRGHPAGGARSLSELRDVEWVVVGREATPGTMIEEAWRVRRLGTPRIRVRCSDYGTLLRIVACSDLMAVIPHAEIVADLRPDRVRPVRVLEGLPRYEVCLFAPRGRPGRSRQVGAVRRRILEAAAQAASGVSTVRQQGAEGA